MEMHYAEPSLRFPGFKTRAITLSFDDGNTQDRQLAEILRQYGLKCTFNLTAGRVTDRPYRVQFEEFAEVYQGHEVACHAFTHPFFHMLDAGGISYQLIKDREALEHVLRRPVQGFAYPYGIITDTVQKCLNASGIRYARTGNSSYNFSLPQNFLLWDPTCHQADPKLPELAEKFFTPDDPERPLRIKPKLFYIWGHSYEYEDNWQPLHDMCALLSGKENVWYATNGEIIDYISAFHALRRSANGRYIYNPTDTDVYVTVNCQRDVVLKKGEFTVLE